MNLLNRAERTLLRAQKALNYQSTLLHAKNAEIADLHQMLLTHYRMELGTLIAIQMALEQGDIDVEQFVDDLIQARSEDIAQLEEYVL